MSRTNKGSKGPGYDYGSRRYGNDGCNSSPTRRKCSTSTKKITNRAERRINKKVEIEDMTVDYKECISALHDYLDGHISLLTLDGLMTPYVWNAYKSNDIALIYLAINIRNLIWQYEDDEMTEEILKQELEKLIKGP